MNKRRRWKAKARRAARVPWQKMTAELSFIAERDVFVSTVQAIHDFGDTLVAVATQGALNAPRDRRLQ